MSASATVTSVGYASALVVARARRSTHVIVLLFMRLHDGCLLHHKFFMYLRAVQAGGTAALVKDLLAPPGSLPTKILVRLGQFLRIRVLEFSV